MPVDAASAIAFLSGMWGACRGGTIASYAGTLGVVLRMLGRSVEDTALLGAFARGARAEDEGEEDGAEPATLQQAQLLVRHSCPVVGAATRFMWVAGARLEDLLRLRGRNVVAAAPGLRAGEFVVRWLSAGKGRRGKLRPASTTCVMLVRSPPLARWLASRPDAPDAPLFPVGKAVLLRELARCSPLLSGHSLRKGAASELPELLPELPERILARWLRHESATDPLPRTSCRYLRQLVSLARYLGTGAVTAALDRALA